VLIVIRASTQTDLKSVTISTENELQEYKF